MLIEPNAHILKKPKSGAMLYKIIPKKYFWDMIENEYLYFRRVDSYNDLKDSDLPGSDKLLCDQIKFELAPHVSLTDYYNRCRYRTYACCFSTKNTKYIWQEYNKNDKESVCLIFNCDKLIEYINSSLNSAILRVGGKPAITDFLSVNYGLIQYVNSEEQCLYESVPNPITYTYLKDRDKYLEDNEFRIAISALGIYESYRFNGEKLNFPENLQLQFSFKTACQENVINKIELYSNFPLGFDQELDIFLRKHDVEIEIGVGDFAF